MGAIRDLKKSLPGVHHVHDIAPPPSGHDSIIPAVVSVPVAVVQISHGIMSVPAGIRM